MTKEKDFIKRVDFSQSIIGSDFNKFQANLIGGNIFILAGPKNQASIRIQWKNSDINTMPKFFVENNILKLESNNLAVFIGQKNAYIIELTIPENIDINIKMFAGVINLKNLTGDIDARVRFGEILGSVSNENLIAKVWAGDIRLEFIKITKYSKVLVKCFLGDIKLKFPLNIISNSNFAKMKIKKIPNILNADISASVFLGDVSIETHNC